MQNMTRSMRTCREVRNFASRKFRLTLVLPVITIKWMANPIVFIVMVTHQCDFTPRMHCTRATTATCAACVRHGVGRKTPFSGRGSRNAAEDPRNNILQLNIEGLTANKIFVIEQLAYKNKVFIIVIQETHCTRADKLVILNCSQLS